MLCVNRCQIDYVDEGRSRMASLLAAYRAVADAKAKRIEAFEPLFFNHLVVALEGCFVHRARGIEGKDGNPLNEVRRLCRAILQNQSVLAAKSITKLKIGQEIKLTEAEFARLAKAFFAEIKARFV